MTRPIVCHGMLPVHSQGVSVRTLRARPPQTTCDLTTIHVPTCYHVTTHRLSDHSVRSGSAPVRQVGPDLHAAARAPLVR